MNRFRRSALAVFCTIVALGSVIRALPAHAAVVVNGGGSSFAQIEFDDWTGETARTPLSLKVSYSAQGSTFGRTGYLNGSLDFGASDIPFQPNEQANVDSSPRKNFVYVPVSAGGLGLMYNVNDDTTGGQITTMKLTRHAACRIFTEETDLYWDDPEFQATNPDVTLPHQLIRTIVRSDGSGTSYVFSAFCIAVAKPLWDAFVSAEIGKNAQDDPSFLNGLPTSNWPQAFGHSNGGFGANGVASLVVDTPGAVTYNEAGFAKAKNFPNAYLENGAGKFVIPTDTNVTKALSYATGRPDGTFELKYSANDPDAYFPSTYSYVIAQTTGFDPAKGEALARFLCYAVTKGQRRELIVDQDYAPLSQPLVDIAHAAIEQIPGAPPWDQCAVSTSGGTSATTTTKAAATTTTKPGSAPATTQSASTATTKAGTSSGTATTKAGTSSGTATTKAVTPNVGVAITVAGGAPVTAADGSQVTSPAVVGPTASSTDCSNGSTVPRDDGSISSVGSLETTAAAQATATSATSPLSDAVPETTSAPPCTIDRAPSPGAADSSDDGQAASATGAPQVAAQVSAKKAGPVVDARKPPIDGQQIAWVLLQGAAVCGLGVLIAGASRKGSVS